MKECRSAFKIFTSKPIRKRPLGRPRRIDNIRMDLEEIVSNVGNWIDLTQDRDYWRALVNAVLILRVSQSMVLVIISKLRTNTGKKKLFKFLTGQEKHQLLFLD